MSGKSPAAFAILANSGSAIRIWWSGEERERAERIAAEDFTGLHLVELYTGDAMREVEKQRDQLKAELDAIKKDIAIAATCNHVARMERAEHQRDVLLSAIRDAKRAAVLMHTGEGREVVCLEPQLWKAIVSVKGGAE